MYDLYLEESNLKNLHTRVLKLSDFMKLFATIRYINGHAIGTTLSKEE